MFPSFCRVVVEFIYSEAEEKLPNLDTQIEEVQCLVEALSAFGRGGQHTLRTLQSNYVMFHESRKCMFDIENIYIVCSISHSLYILMFYIL